MASEQWYGRQSRGGDGVLDGQVDPHSAGWGHGVGGIADAQQAIGVPAAQAVEPDIEEFDLVPGRNYPRIDTTSEITRTMSDKWL